MNKQLKDKLFQAIATQDGSMLENCLYDLETIHIHKHAVPSSDFKTLLAVLKSSELLNMESSNYYFFFLTFDWDRLTSIQKNLLLPALEEAFGELKDPMSCFMISVLLGENYRNDQAFNALVRLGSVKSDSARRHVPHGLEHIVTGCEDEELSGKALAALGDMCKDPCEEVRIYLIESLLIVIGSCRDDVARKAVAYLSQMKTDPSMNIRKWVKSILMRIKTQRPHLLA